MSTQTAVEQTEIPKSKPKIKGRWKSALSLSFASMMDNNEGTTFISSLFPIIRSQLGMTLGQRLLCLYQFSRRLPGGFTILWLDS